MMNWISVKDRLPVIPEGKYGISILVAEFDPVFEELCPGRGYTVKQGHYGRIVGRNGKVLPHFLSCNYNELDGPQFMELWVGDNVGFGPVFEEITHWMPMPEPPTFTFVPLNKCDGCESTSFCYSP